MPVFALYLHRALVQVLLSRIRLDRMLTNHYWYLTGQKFPSTVKSLQ